MMKTVNALITFSIIFFLIIIGSPRHSVSDGCYTEEEIQQFIEEMTMKGEPQEKIDLAIKYLKSKCESSKEIPEDEKDHLDNLLRSMWDEMRNSLAQNDIDTWTSYFSAETRDKYKNFFERLPADKLLELSHELSDISLIAFKGSNYAEYDLRKTIDGKTYSCLVIFIKNLDGEWKIRSF